MTEMDLLKPEIQRLFEKIDLAPVPESRIVREAFDFWDAQRKGALAPRSSVLVKNLPAEESANAFLFCADPDADDFHAVFAGQGARQALGALNERNLMKAANRRLSVCLRRVFNLALERVEPVSAQFEVGSERYEVLAAPATGCSGEADSVFGALASRHEGEGWRP